MITYKRYTMNHKKSSEAFGKAKKFIPGGVNSPARAFKSVNQTPLFIDKASGSRVTDIDGNEYIDYIGSWGPMILGHSHPEVLRAVENANRNGQSFGAPTLIETEMAELISEMVPGVEMVRMVNSGTEATMSALRLARGYTGRDLVVKFEGCYHGHCDSFLIKAGSGALTLGSPDSPGVTQGSAKDTLIAKFNDISSVQEIFQEKGSEIAAVILEPVAGNMGVVKPEARFLTALRELCTQNGAVLIFDEVMCGFRVSKGGAQELYNIIPDLSAFGKVIGGGMPVGAFGGKKEIMEHLAPLGTVYQAGTLAGNPIAMAAGYTTLKILNEDKGVYEKLEEKSSALEQGLRENLDKAGVPGVVNRAGSMLTLFFTGLQEVSTHSHAVSSDTGRFADYYNKCLREGIYFPPSQFEALFVSLAHSDEDISYTIDKSYEALKSL